MYADSTDLYDKLYAWKDYAAEAEAVAALVREHKRSQGSRLLDLACGTGGHLEYLRDRFDAEGLDLSEGMLAIARKRLPGLPLHRGDLADFDLGTRYDVITCLFSSIGYVKTTDRLRAALERIAHHLEPGGVVLVEPWFDKESFFPNTVHMQTVDEPELKLCRMNTSIVEGDVSILDLHHLVATPEGTRHFVEHHELGLFSAEEHAAAFEAAGLEHTWLPAAGDRGMHLGVRPTPPGAPGA
jgi:SAM-dependent methyltransferase